MQSSFSEYWKFVFFCSDYFRIYLWIFKCELIVRVVLLLSSTWFSPFHHHFYVDLDFGSDIILIKDGKVSNILQRPESLYKMLAPLSTNINEVQFTWRSFPLVSRHFSFHFRFVLDLTPHINKSNIFIFLKNNHYFRLQLGIEETKLLLFYQIGSKWRRKFLFGFGCVRPAYLSAFSVWFWDSSRGFSDLV